jgi:hypothetical protein
MNKWSALTPISGVAFWARTLIKRLGSTYKGILVKKKREIKINFNKKKNI